MGEVFLSLFRQTWIPCLGDPFCEIFGGDAEACFCPGFPFFGFFTRGKDVFHGGACVAFGVCREAGDAFRQDGGLSAARGGG